MVSVKPACLCSSCSCAYLAMVYSLWYFRFSFNLGDEVKCLYVVLFRHVTALFDVKTILGLLSVTGYIKIQRDAFNNSDFIHLIQYIELFHL